MSRSRSLILFGVLCVISSGLTAQAGPLDALPSEGWVSWRVSSTASGDGPCCYEFRNGHSRSRGCHLQAGGQHAQAVSLDAMPGEADELVLYLHRRNGQSDALHALAANCPVKLDGPVHTLPLIGVADSLRFLDATLDASKGPRRESVIMAIAHHDGNAAAEVLVARAAADQTRALRRDALFWLAQRHPANGLETLRRTATTDEHREIRHHALFALSQADLSSARLALRAIAADAGLQDEDRGQALFWLVQADDPDARDIVLDTLKQAKGELAEQAVFALSQLDEGADDALIAVVEGDYPRTVRKRALFWLGQSGSDSALRYLDRLLNADPTARSR
jgi:HEAT repeat protein